MIVVDASIALSWVIASQNTDAANALLRTANAEFVAPYIFQFEIRNALLEAERRDKAQPCAVDEAIHSIMANFVSCEPPPDEPHLLLVFDLARQERLSFFDASYLECAMRIAATLATRDGPLLEAAARRNVTAYDAR